MLFSSRGECTYYFGLPSLSTPFLDWVAEGVDHIKSRPANFPDQPALSRKQEKFIEVFRLDGALSTICIDR